MATDQTRYDAFVERVERLTYLQGASGVLSWDQQVMMPEGGTPARSRQLSTLSTMGHELLTNDEMAADLDALEADDSLVDPQQAVVREVRRQHDRAVRVPSDLVERTSRATSEALGVWEEAKAEDDFDLFAPKLEELIQLKRDYAEHVDPDADPYAVLFADYEPYLDLDTAERVLTRLREELVPLVDRIRESDVELAVDAFSGQFDTERQQAASRDALDTLGYDWDRGRLDVSSHPFTSGNQFDARVTTRFDESDPLGALTATVHEFGHAQYMLGLPDDHYGTPLGDDRDLTVHESQSRLWENHVGRTEEWWGLFLPTFTDHFPDVEATPRDAYEAANQVYEDNLIRVEADELTYHMHIVLRFEIERDLIAGDLDVSEVPQVWNDKMEEYLGVRPETDAEGCLQDIHWSHANFGYFPTYSLGSVLAAQLDSAVREDLDLSTQIRAGEFEPLREWLYEHVHRHGARYTTPELVEQATGEEYTADHFLDYVTEKYERLYDL
ncbi:carboxypeptidase M32 [Halomarina oriensis]|uniref:Metal-dependent carboxypeptidase n=1 Tax=Halomarina oriensis TaxID=671145 RepID=A0A6B0GVK6_9EURY|nr:carboxypeptidase M32 [Halomarina oriensis]MWG36623.1 carboxypeptidase M32 [Halomarina oriensis]